MWMSKMISKYEQNQKAEKGSVTLSDRCIETDGTVKARNIESFAPYGYQTVPPVGEEVMLLPSSHGQVIIGSKSENSDLESGEIKISSKGGASIILKNDGSVMINSAMIDKNGVMIN